MANLSIKVTKHNSKKSITVNKTAAGNKTITGTVYAAEEVMVTTRQGSQDASTRIIDTQCSLIFAPTKANQALLEQAIAETDAFIASNKTSFVGIVVEANEVSLPVGGNVLVKDILSIAVEKPEMLVDLDSFEAVAQATRTERNLSWAQKLQNKLFSRAKV